MPKKDKRTPLQKEIDRVSEKLSHLNPDTDEYKDLLTTLKSLESMENERRKTKDPRKKVDPNVIISIFGELLGMGVIMNFERLHVLSTKAFTRLWRARL